MATIYDDGSVIVRLIESMPMTTRGFVVQSPDGTYNIYLNARHSAEILQKTFQHEMKHIKRGDLSSGLAVAVIEEEIDDEY